MALLSQALAPVELSECLLSENYVILRICLLCLASFTLKDSAHSEIKSDTLCFSTCSFTLELSKMFLCHEFFWHLVNLSRTCVRVRVCAHTHVYMHVFVFICVCCSVCIYVCHSVCMCVAMYVCMHVLCCSVL